MAVIVRSRAEQYAAGQYEAQGRTCLHFGGDGAWHHSGHEHATAAEAGACTAERRGACVARIMEHGHSELE